MEVLEPFLQINPRELSSFTAAPSFNFPPNFLCNSLSLPPHYEFCLFHCLHLYFNNISNPNSPLSMNSLHISTKSLRADRFLCLSQVRELHLIKIGSPDILYSLVINVGNSFQLFFFQILFCLFVYKIITILRVCVSVLHPGYIYPGFVHTHGSTTCNSVSIFVQPSQLGQLLVNLVNFFAHTHSSTLCNSVSIVGQLSQLGQLFCPLPWFKYLQLGKHFWSNLVNLVNFLLRPMVQLFANR